MKPESVIINPALRSVPRIYAMTFTQNTWKLWRNTAGFSQRVEGKISADHATITAQWEKSFDGETWEHDFNVRYKRVI